MGYDLFIAIQASSIKYILGDCNALIIMHNECQFLNFRRIQATFNTEKSFLLI